MERLICAVALIVGGALGALVLGAGGRVVMRIIAIQGGGAGDFSVGGTLNVVAAGAGYGLGGAVLFMLVRLVFPARRWARGLAFWVVVTLVTLRVLQGVAFGTGAMFLPLVALYGAALHLWWCRVCGPRHAAAKAPRATTFPAPRARLAS